MSNLLDQTGLTYFWGKIKSILSLKVDKDEALLSLNTAAASSTPDGKLYAAITALDWQNDVIVS